MVAREKFWLILIAGVFIGGILILARGHDAPVGLRPGAPVVCTQTTLAVQDPGHQFFEPLAVPVEIEKHLWIAESDHWRERTNFIPPDYYVLVRNEADTVLGYVLEDYLVPTDQG